MTGKQTNLEPLKFDLKPEFKLKNNKQENMINQNSAVMSEETEISRDFLTNKTIFSEDETNANILKDYTLINDEKIKKSQAKTLFGTEEELNKSWPRQVSTNFIKKLPMQNHTPEVLLTSVIKETLNRNIFSE